jgi:SAM-dependent methyltransferase
MTRSDKDFYETPEVATYPIMVECIQNGLVDRWGTVLDLGCGDGRLGRAAGAAYEFETGLKALVRGVEIDPDRAEIASRNGVMVSEGPLEFYDGDTLATQPGLVISNPPFSAALEFLEFALNYHRLTYSDVLFLLPVGYLGSQHRHAFWKANPPDAMRVFSKRLSFTGDGKTANADYAWFYWGGALGGLKGIDFYP